MLWLKAWFETRWRFAWMLVFDVLIFSLPFEAFSGRGGNAPRIFSVLLLPLSMFLCFITAVSLAGSGIQTASPRPGPSQKGVEGSMLFTLALPVTRTRLFAVRTVIGVLETLGLLALFWFVIWLLVPALALSAHHALSYFVVIAAFTLLVYAVSACLSTFCDEGWRIRATGLAMVVPFMLSTAGRLPKSIDIFRTFGNTSPLISYQVPWATIGAACVLTLLFFAAALTIIRNRDY